MIKVTYDKHISFIFFLYDYMHTIKVENVNGVRVGLLLLTLFIALSSFAFSSFFLFNERKRSDSKNKLISI